MYKDLEAMLHMERRVIGIKRLPVSPLNEPQYSHFESVKHKAYYCWLVKKATEGRAFRMFFENFACETAGWVLGLTPSDYFGTPEENAAGWYQCGTFASEKVARLISEGIKPLEASGGLLVGPLEAFPPHCEPDVVIIVGNPYTLMRVIQGYSAVHGFAGQIKLSGMCGICFESTAHPLQTQSISISTLCSGTRYYAKWGMDEMSASMPYHQLADLEKGLKLTLNPCEPNVHKANIEKKLIKPLSINYNSNYYIPK